MFRQVFIGLNGGDEKGRYMSGLSSNGFGEFVREIK
jgi:hypothetical protein